MIIPHSRPLLPIIGEDVDAVHRDSIALDHPEDHHINGHLQTDLITVGVRM